jgi:hypothetical protein
MISKIGVPGVARIDLIGHAPGDLSFISEMIFHPASLLEGEICDQTHTYLHSLQTFCFFLVPGLSIASKKCGISCAVLALVWQEPLVRKSGSCGLSKPGASDMSSSVSCGLSSLSVIDSRGGAAA